MFTQRANSPKSASLSFLSNQNPNKLIPFPWPAATNPTNPLSPHPYPSPRNNSSLRPVSGPLRPFSTFPSPQKLPAKSHRYPRFFWDFARSLWSFNFLLKFLQHLYALIASMFSPWTANNVYITTSIRPTQVHSDIYLPSLSLLLCQTLATQIN